MYTDTYIDYWGEIYQKTRLNEYDLSFGIFMTDPEGYLEEAGQESAPDCIDNDFEPLLPAQAAVALIFREQEREIIYQSSGLECTIEGEEIFLEQKKRIYNALKN